MLMMASFICSKAEGFFFFFGKKKAEASAKPKPCTTLALLQYYLLDEGKRVKDYEIKIS